VTDDSFFFVGAFGIYTGILRGTVGIRQRSIDLFAGALGGLLRSFLPVLTLVNEFVCRVTLLNRFL
jgi:hypothetical protein